MLRSLRITLVSLAASAGILTTGLAPASAAANPSIIYSPTANACMAASSASLGAPVTLATCDSDSSQQWVFTSEGKFRLIGTSKYIVSSASGSALGTDAEGTEFVYVNHQLAANSNWLTEENSDSEAYLALTGPPGSQTWDVFTSVQP